MRILHHGGREYRAPLQSSHCTPINIILFALRRRSTAAAAQQMCHFISQSSAVLHCYEWARKKVQGLVILFLSCRTDACSCAVAAPHESPFMRCWNEEQWLVSKDWIKVFPEFRPDIENQPITQTDASHGNRLFASHLFFSRRRLRRRR